MFNQIKNHTSYYKEGDLMLEERVITSRRVPKYERAIINDKKKISLTEREKQVIMALYYHRCLTTRQLAEMFYFQGADGTENSQREVIARRSLRKLFNAEYIDRFYIDVGTGGTSQGHIVLDKKGAHLVAALLNVPYRSLKWEYEMNEVRLPYLEHLVNINDVYIDFLRATRANGHELGEFRTEQHCKHSFQFWGNQIICNPDAYGQYWYSKDEGFHYFLELDNGTMTLPVFQKKQRRYAGFYASQSYKGIYDEFPYILTVTTTKERAYQLRDIIYAIDNTDLKWLFTTKEQLASNPLGEIWVGEAQRTISLL